MEQVRFGAADPRGPEAQESLRRYLEEMASNLGNPALWPGALDDVDDYLPPAGRFLVGRLGDKAVACGALRTLEQGTGEIKRMWVDPALRGRKVGAALLAALEEAGRAAGFTTLRLDTSGVLTAARALYASQGYVEIARYNDNPDATHFFEKILT